MFAKYFKGTKNLTAFIFRQQRFKIIIWLISLIGITLLTAASYQNIYNDEVSMQAASVTMDNPAMVAMLGPGYETEDYFYTIGTMFANEMLLFTAIAVAIMSILLVGRTTRADEEDGRIEMIRALAVGRLSYASAAMIVIVSTNILLVILIGVGLTSLGIKGINLESSFLYGSILGVTGLLFAAITAVFAQLTETSRGTTMFSFIVLIVAYLVRAIGDVSSDWLSWLTPLGWTVRTGVFVENQWWPVIISLIISIIIGIVAFYLQSIRDLGSGFIAARKGKAHASSFLQSPFGLTVRLQRTNIIAWAIGLLALSSSFGAVLDDLEAYYGDIEFIQAFIEAEAGYTMTEQFISLLITILTLISVIPAVTVILKLKGEETKNLTENYYSRAVSRSHVLGSYYILAVIASVLMQSMIALGLWSVSEVMMDEPLLFSTTFATAYVYMPAILVVIGLVVVLLGIVPKFTGFIWIYVVYCFVVVYLGDLLEFPKWMNSLSVFEYIPKIPVDNVSFIEMIVITMIAIIITVIGFIGYNKRDIAG